MKIYEPKTDMLKRNKNEKGRSYYKLLLGVIAEVQNVAYSARYRQVPQ